MSAKKTSQPKIGPGTILLAEPFMADSHFKRSALLLCEHNDEGSLGFILNKSMKVDFNELVPGFPEFKATVGYGGPVGTDTLHYIHNVGDLLDDSVEIGRGVHWSGDFEKLKFLIETELILPKNIRFFVGYSGWSSGQLVSELKYGSWVTADMHANYLFKSHHFNLWKQIMNNKGDSYSVIAQMPDDISTN